MSIRLNDGVLGTKIAVPTREPGELNPAEVKAGQAGRVQMTSGEVLSLGGEAYRIALRNGGQPVE